MTQPLSLAQISLRRDERGFVVGGTGAGKSTLCALLAGDFMQRYPTARQLILDSKPRYRAEWTIHGTKAARRYRKWGHGPLVPGSVVVDDPADLRMAWKLGHRTVIMQCETQRDRARLVAGADAFLKDSSAKRPQLLHVDETMDFFNGNGSPISGNDAIERAARAGRERGTAALYGSQRTKQIPTQIMGLMQRCYAMRLDYVADVKRLGEMGMPPFAMPTEPHIFMYWTKARYRTVYGPYKLDLGG